MRHLRASIALALFVGLLPHVASAQVPDLAQPHPDPAFISPEVPAAPCTVENEYEASIYGLEVGDVRYEGVCNRIRFTFGPILVKPGQNEALIEPVTIEKPAYDGYIVRFKPDLLRASDGVSPPTEDMHLHHATWLNAGNSYGDGPFFASGEEKTIATFPEGYGMQTTGADRWLLLYMVHNDISASEVVWLTYDLDFILTAEAEGLGMVPVKPLWLDVQKHRVHPEAPSTSSNPVFNVQRGFGQVDPEIGRRVCRWPAQNCARHDMYGMVTPNQGATVDSSGQPIEILGTDYVVPEDMAGTIVGLGGHLHFGGIQDEVSLVRNGVEKPIFISNALYWDWERRDEDRVGAPPWSWDFSMTVTGAPDWKVEIKEGDVIRINTVVDTQDASWYENMGIVVALVAPNDPHGLPGIDPFASDVTIDPGYPSRALVPEGPWDAATGWTPSPCSADLDGSDGSRTLCLRGVPTHGPMDESGDHSGGCPPEGCPDLDYVDGPVVTEIRSAGFTYGEADFGVINTLGIPQLEVGQPARFWNYDTVARVWHTFTRCEYPCTGQKDMAYPFAGGGVGSPDDVMDFDSNEIGYGTFFEPAAGQLGSDNKPFQQTIEDGLFWDFTPTEPGVYTFFCRIHRDMRGAFRVVE